MEAFYAHPDAEEWIADWEIEQERCKFHGGPYSECPDFELDWYPQRSRCVPTMQLEAVKRLYELRHKDEPFHDGKEMVWSDKPSALTPFRYDDGVTIWLSQEDLSPDDDFLGQSPKSPAD